MSELIHATAVAIGERAVLIIGPSGAGKSDLALRLIDRGAQLVSDDQVVLQAGGDRLLASPPPAIAGKMEVRGIGIIAMPYQAQLPVALLIDLGEEMERMPEPLTRSICGQAVPLLALRAFEASAPLKVEQGLIARGLPR